MSLVPAVGVSSYHASERTHRKRSRNTFADYIRYRNGKIIRVEFDKIIQVSADSEARLIRCGDFQSRHFRRGLRYHSSLNNAGQPNLLGDLFALDCFCVIFGVCNSHCALRGNRPCQRDIVFGKPADSRPVKSQHSDRGILELHRNCKLTYNAFSFRCFFISYPRVVPHIVNDYRFAGKCRFYNRVVFHNRPFIPVFIAQPKSAAHLQLARLIV